MCPCVHGKRERTLSGAHTLICLSDQSLMGRISLLLHPPAASSGEALSPLYSPQLWASLCLQTYPSQGTTSTLGDTEQELLVVLMPPTLRLRGEETFSSFSHRQERGHIILLQPLLPKTFPLLTSPDLPCFKATGGSSANTSPCFDKWSYLVLTTLVLGPSQNWVIKIFILTNVYVKPW